MQADVFIGYSRRDSAPAEAIQAALANAGLRWYRDVTHIPGSEEWQTAITEAISESQAYLALLSSDSIASRHVSREMQIAYQLEKPFIQVVLKPDLVIPPKLFFAVGGLQHLYLQPSTLSGLNEITSVALRLVDQAKNRAAYDAEADVKARANLNLSVDLTADTLGLPVGKAEDYEATVRNGSWIITTGHSYWGHYFDRMPRVSEFVAEVNIQKYEGADEKLVRRGVWWQAAERLLSGRIERGP